MSDKINFYLNHSEPIKSCLMAMQSIVLNYNSEIIEIMKYGLPCFLYRGKPMIYLWVDKKTKFPYYLFDEGRFIAHPKLEKGDRKRMKIYPINPNVDLDIAEIHVVIKMAIDVQDEIIEAKKKK